MTLCRSINLIRLSSTIEPGGYLQWGESDVLSPTMRKTHPSNSSSALEELVRLFKDKGPKMQPTWVKNLPALFEEVGFENVKDHIVKASERDSYWMFECNQLAYQMFLGKDEAMEKMYSEATKEVKNGVMLEVDRLTVIGRKALAAEG